MYKNNEVNKGSTKIFNALNILENRGTVKVATNNIFRDVIKILSKNYSKLIEGKSINVDYGNLEITLN